MCEATFAAAAGVVSKHDVEVSDHPACDAEEGERFIPVAVTPPREEGNAEACLMRRLFRTALPLEEGCTRHQ